MIIVSSDGYGFRINESNTISNTVVNAQGTGTATIRDVDIFTLEVPEGFTLSEINITNFVSADNVGFAGVIEGNTFPVDFGSNGTDSSDFLVQQNGDNPIEYTFDFVLTETASDTSAATVPSETVFTSTEVEFDFAPAAESALSEAEFAFDQLEESEFGSFDDLGDVFEVA